MSTRVEQQSESLTRLRILVLTLGGAAHAKWWRTEFLTATGLSFLERLYPRTSRSAAVHATAVAARALHDSSIGRGGVYHLFRLPEALESHLHVLAEDGFLEHYVRTLEPNLETRDALLAQFDDLLPVLPETEPGPQRIGSVRELDHSLVVGKWAGAYLYAFLNEYRVFPYVEAEQNL